MAAGPQLGRGSQGQTYLATEVARRQEVVIKRVKLGAGWKSFELHERETKVLAVARRVRGAARHVQPGEAVDAGHRS